MFASFLTVLCFAFSISFAERSARQLGGMRANMSRMVVSLCLLGAWSHSFGTGLGGPAFVWFFLSGVVGFGLGDLGLYLSLPRIGPRLAILLCQCLAAPFGAAIEWAWLGTSLTLPQMFCGAVILAGVVLAIAPPKTENVASGTSQTISLGVLLGIVAALGQALGAVISRKAYTVAAAADWLPDGGTAAYQRMLGGIILTTLVFVISPRRVSAPEQWRRAWPWILLNALSGPTLGVAIYQWALATTHTGVVLSIVAMSPVATIPVAYWISGDRPPRRSLMGGFIAVAGAIVMAYIRH